MPFHHLSTQHLGYLESRYAAAGERMQGQVAQLATLRQALSYDGPRFEEGQLEQLLPAIAEFLTHKAIKGWLFKANNAGKPLAYVVTRIDFTPPGEEETGRILLDLKANSLAKITTIALIIRERDIIGKTVAEIFAAQGYLKETPEQTDLIDILTAEMDVLMDDIIEGKSGGTTVLCADPAGVGKTLTAEVYSEIIKRPLYRVHSGQLGLNVTEMEIALKNTLVRAQRWGAVMLIDEADVYIKRRDDNIAANAVVGVFLRVLEYFNGLLFLTTNRAILMRRLCRAVLR